MKKILFFSIAIIAFLSIVPTIFALDEYGKVTDITERTGDSLTSGKGTIKTEGNTTTIRYSAATFKVLEKDESQNRPGPAAWIGFEVTEPTDDNDSKFKVTTPDSKTTEVKASFYRDYVGITTTNLKNNLLKGNKLTYKYSFDWDENGQNDQYVIIEIDPEKITLLDVNGKDKVWSPEIAKAILEENPNTGDINILFYLGLIILAGIGLIYYLKKA